MSQIDEEEARKQAELRLEYGEARDLELETKRILELMREGKWESPE
jgi:hypothetical protein